jgi:hypothetical protein
VSASRQSALDIAVFALVEESLALWGRPGTLHRDPNGAIVVETAEHHVRIERAEIDLPFRWLVVIDGRRRVAGSVIGLLRALRLALDADFQPSRVRIASIDAGPQ